MVLQIHSELSMRLTGCQKKLYCRVLICNAMVSVFTELLLETVLTECSLNTKDAPAERRCLAAPTNALPEIDTVKREIYL